MAAEGWVAGIGSKDANVLLPAPGAEVIFKKMPPWRRRTQRVGRPTLSNKTLAGNSKVMCIKVSADSRNIGIDAIARPNSLQ